MARSRNIKPGLYKNEDLAECSVWARFIFPGLWCIADREGRLEDRPKRIKGELLPFDNEDVEPLLAELARNNFLLRYEVDGVRYIQILTFLKHQNPHHKEAPSSIPAPPGLVMEEPNKDEKPEALPSCKTPKASDSPPDAQTQSPGQALGKTEASPGQASDLPTVEGGLNPADSLFSDSLIPDSLISDSKKCAEVQSTIDAVASPVVVEILTNTKALYPVTQAQVDSWAPAYPGVDIAIELQKIRVWAETNGPKRKTAGGMPKFITAWLGRAQDDPKPQGFSTPFRGRKNAHTTDFSTQNYERDLQNGCAPD